MLEPHDAGHVRHDDIVDTTANAWHVPDRLFRLQLLRRQAYAAGQRDHAAIDVKVDSGRNRKSFVERVSSLDEDLRVWTILHIGCGSHRSSSRVILGRPRASLRPPEHGAWCAVRRPG